MISRQIIVGGLLTNYYEQGEGPVFLCLHGWGDDGRTFQKLIPALAGYKFIALDLPGFGKTEKPTETWGLNNYANFVSHFIEKLQIPEVSVLLGHSNGGAIAIRGIGNDELSPKKLILLASSGIRDKYRARKKILRLAAKTAKALTKPLPQKTQAKLKKGAYKTIGSDLFVAEHLQETFKKVVTDDVQLDATKLALPTLIIYGQEDTATPPSYAQRFHELIKDSKLYILPGAGHFVLNDQTEEAQKKVTEFLS